MVILSANKFFFINCSQRPLLSWRSEEKRRRKSTYEADIEWDEWREKGTNYGNKQTAVQKINTLKTKSKAKTVKPNGRIASWISFNVVLNDQISKIAASYTLCFTCRFSMMWCKWEYICSKCNKMMFIVCSAFRCRLSISRLLCVRKKEENFPRMNEDEPRKPTSTCSSLPGKNDFEQWMIMIFFLYERGNIIESIHRFLKINGKGKRAKKE